LLGHEDPSVTLRIYADLFDSDLDASPVSLDARIAEYPRHLLIAVASGGKALSSCVDMSIALSVRGGT
jgi:hypothetical protein